MERYFVTFLYDSPTPTCCFLSGAFMVNLLYKKLIVRIYNGNYILECFKKDFIHNSILFAC